MISRLWVTRIISRVRARENDLSARCLRDEDDDDDDGAKEDRDSETQSWVQAVLVVLKIFASSGCQTCYLRDGCLRNQLLSGGRCNCLPQLYVWRLGISLGYSLSRKPFGRFSALGGRIIRKAPDPSITCLLKAWP